MRSRASHLLAALLCIITLAGCAPVLVGGLLYKSSKSKQQKQEFMNNFQRVNLEREAKGLKPLDWCAEAYRFDKGWAAEDAACAERIKRYETGDKTALDIDPAGSPLTSVQPALGTTSPVPKQ